MASPEFKDAIIDRFNELVEELFKRGIVKNNTGIARLIKQPLQLISKLLGGERILTLEQLSALSTNAGVNPDWVLTGNGSMFKENGVVPPVAEDIIAQVSKAAANGDMPEYVAAKVIAEITSLREMNEQQKDELNKLNKKIIQMLS